MQPLDYYVSILEQAGVTFALGLSAAEVAQIEAFYQFRFPPDYRAFVMHALPDSKGFPNWRSDNTAPIEEQLSWPLEGMCFDIEHNQFWLRAWGERPAALQDAFTVAKQAVAAAPRLIPVFGHRYIPETPRETGNPIFSVYQTDIIYYGRTLFLYFENEWGYKSHGQNQYHISEPIKYTPFWSYLVDINDGSVDDGRYVS